MLMTLGYDFLGSSIDVSINLPSLESAARLMVSVINFLSSKGDLNPYSSQTSFKDSLLLGLENKQLRSSLLII